MLYTFEILKLLWIGFELSGAFHPKYQQVFSAQVPKHIQTLMESNCSSIEEKYFPLVKVQHGDELYNSSFELNESSDVVNEHSGFVFSITCVAYYPIQWVVNYFYNGYPNGNFGLHLQVHRMGKFKDPSTYKFSISSKLRYKNNHGFKNFSFSCQSVDRPSCLHTILFTSFDEKHDGPKRNGVKVNVISGPSWENESISELIPTEDEQLLSTSSSREKDEPKSTCDFKVYENNLGLNRYALSCEFADGIPGIVKIIHQCSNAISCMTFHQQHHQPLLPEKCAQPQVPNSCPTCPKRTVPLSQGFLACVAADDKDNHHHHGKLLFFFSSVPQESHNHSSKLYYNMEHVEPSEMLSLAKINKKVSLGDSIHVVCNSSSYHFASGTKFGVKYKGSEDLTYIKGIANPSNGPGSEYFPANVYEGNIPITTSSGVIERIYCFAPTWNSFTWINKSIDVKGAVIVEAEKGSPHTLIVVSVTLILTSLCCCLLFGLCWMKILRRKLSKFGKLLTPQEVDEFRRPPPPILDNGKNQNDYDYVNTSLMGHNPNNKNTGDSFYLEIRREQLLLDETVVLGKGHFGKVLKGVYKDEKNEKMDVAIKTLKTKTDVGALKSLLSELKIMATVGKNLNVVNLIGACTKRMQKGEVYVAVEYCANGNLQNYLRTHRDRFQNQLQRDILIVETPYSIRKSVDDESILSLDLIKWAWEIGRGMEFLSSKKVIHSDLALRNILLTSDKIAKVSDFGLSRQLVDYYYVKEESDVAMPWKWMAIETLREMKFSVQSDVWSMGVVLWELFSLAEIPYYGCSWSLDFVAALDAGHRLGKVDYASSEIYDLMLACWKVDPSDRPSFFTIKTFFEDIITQCTYQDYMQLDLCGTGSHNHHNSADTMNRTPTIEIVSDCEVEDDVFEQ